MLAAAIVPRRRARPADRCRAGLTRGNGTLSLIDRLNSPRNIPDPLGVGSGMRRGTSRCAGQDTVGKINPMRTLRTSDMPGSGEMLYSCARLKACSAPSVSPSRTRMWPSSRAATPTCARSSRPVSSSARSAFSDALAVTCHGDGGNESHDCACDVWPYAAVGW